MIARQTFTVENVDGLLALEFHAEKNFSGLYAEWARAGLRPFRTTDQRRGGDARG